MKITNEQFTSTEVMKAAGLKPVQFQNWLKSTAVKSVDSGNVVIHSEGIRGKERTFSYYALMTFVTAKVLSDVHLPPKRAFELALRFAATDDIQGETREVGLPCNSAHGDTYLISDGLRDEGSDRLRYAIVTRKEGEEWDDVFQKASLYSEGSAPARLTVNLSKLFERVMIGMNRDPGELLNEVYGEVSG